MATHRQLRQRMLIGLSSLLALLLGIIAMILISEHRDRPTNLLGAEETISRLTINRTGQDALVLENHNNQWVMSEPCELPLTTSRIEPLLSALSNVAGSYHRDEVDLSEAGLVEPTLIITMDDDAIAIGAIDSSGERRYAMLGMRVGFVPEWVQSLANGGISALAQLEVFSSPLSKLGNVSAGELPAWQALTASQIVLWPLADAPAALSTQTLDLVFTNGRQATATLTRNASYTALQLGNSQCAYILSNEDIPE